MYIEASQETTRTLQFIFSWLLLPHYLFLHIKITLSNTCDMFIYVLPSLFQHQLQAFAPESAVHCLEETSIARDEANPNQQSSLGEEELSGEDIKMVMQRLGISPSPEDGNVSGRLGSGEISLLFADDEPSLQEVMDAFHVFDENRDGFIDAKELQRVLFRLGFREASNAGLCNVMIRAFDENGDGRIDFKEFVKLVEKDFC